MNLNRVVIVSIAALILTIANGRVARAQETLPVTPDPAECQTSATAPRTIENLEAVFAAATPVAESTLDNRPGETASVPHGVAASAETVAALTAVMQTVVACINAGDFARAFAHFTDHAIVAIFPWIGDALADPEVRAMIENPAPLTPGEYETFVALANVMDLPNGNAAAFFILIDPVANWSGPYTLFLEFTHLDGRWLIDNATDFGLDSND